MAFSVGSESFVRACRDLELLCFQELEEACVGLSEDEVLEPTSVNSESAGMIVRSWARIGIEKCVGAAGSDDSQEYTLARAFLALSLQDGLWESQDLVDDTVWRDEALFYRGWLLELAASARHHNCTRLHKDAARHFGMCLYVS